MTDFHRLGLRAGRLLAAIVLAGGAAHAQATFSLSSSTNMVVSTGHAEPLGAITFTVSSGTSTAGAFEVDLGSDIVLTTPENAIVVTPSTGAPTTGYSASQDEERGIITVNLPAGLTQGQSVTVEGVRFSVPASGITTLTAGISSSVHRLGQLDRQVQVLGGVMQGLILDAESDSSFAFTSRGVASDQLGNFTFNEGFASAWVDETASGVSGPTQIVFRVPSLPANTQLVFPASIDSGVGSTLVLNDCDWQNVDISTCEARDVDAGLQEDPVIYEFVGAEGGASSRVLDGFSFRPTLNTDQPGVGTGYFQVSLGPIGALEPTMDLPSTARPRYDALWLPASGPGGPRSKTLRFTVDPEAESQTFTVSNVGTGAAPLTLTAIGADGETVEAAGVDGEVSRTLGGQRTLTFTLADTFGTAATRDNVAWVEVVAASDRIVGASTGAVADGDYTVHSQTPISPAFFPFNRADSTQVPVLSVVGESPEATDWEWTLYDDAGMEQARVTTEDAEPGAAVRGALHDVFGVDVSTLPLAGHVRVESDDADFRGAIVDNPGALAHSTPALLRSSVRRRVYPYFSKGAGYDTIVTLVNGSDQNAFARLTAYGADGMELGSRVTNVPSNTMDELSWGEILGPDTFQWGWFDVEVRGTTASPFATPPRVAAAVRVEAVGDSRASSPLSVGRGDELFFTPVRSSDTEYTGLAILNGGSEEMTVTVEAWSADGEMLASSEEEIAADAVVIAALRTLLAPDEDPDPTPDPEAVDESYMGQDGGYVRVSTESTRMMAIGFLGRVDRGRLTYLHPQTAP